ncbi:MAG TPA: TolC family protein [Vicinamibacterales bacterium]|nr:TolC family protein [Vicinamibacterales bacterium]
MTRTLIASIAILFAADVAAAQESPAVVRLTVADAVARGLETSHRLAELRAREQGAQAAVTAAGLADRPTFNAAAGYTRTNHVAEFFITQPSGLRVVVYPDIPDNFSTRVGFQWPIYTSGRTDALERAATAEASAVAADIETARADLKLEIVRAYWAAATAREAARVLEESSARVDAQLTDARQRFNVGLIPPNEVTSLEAQRSRERAQLIEAGNLREATLIDLRRLIGLPPGTVIELSEGLADAPTPAATAAIDEVVARAMESRPERRALEQRAGAAEARHEAALKATRPTVSLFGGLDYAKPNPRIFPRQPFWQRTWELGANANWNFYDFGRAKAQAAEAAAVVTATRERLAELDTIVSADVRQRLLDLDSSHAIVRATSDAVTSAAEARRVVTDRFAAGVATSTDVLVAQVALLESELARTRALANVRLAEARLDRALGRD